MIESPRHDLDGVIDRVAAKMVAVPEDAGLLSRTLARLPERAATPWFLSMRVQVAAAAGVVLVAFLFARPSPEAPQALATAPVEILVSSDATSVLPVRPLALAKPSPRPGLRTLAPDPRPPIADPREDHERSLAPVDPIEALELGGIAPPAIELDAPAFFEPLVLTELALDTEGEE